MAKELSKAIATLGIWGSMCFVFWTAPQFGLLFVAVGLMGHLVVWSEHLVRSEQRNDNYWRDDMRKEKYRQVELKQFSVCEQGEVIARLVTHIPSKFAVLHKELYVEDEPGVWKVTWVALEDIEMLPDVHSEIKKHRQNQMTKKFPAKEQPLMSFTVEIYQKDLYKIGSNYISGSLAPYIAHHHKLPEEVVISFEVYSNQQIQVPEFLLPCLLEDVINLMNQGIKIKIATFTKIAIFSGTKQP